jgi:methyl-accepting chemotaxis protein
MRLANLKIGPRIGLVAIIGMLAILTVESIGMRKTMVAEREDKLRNVTEVAVGVIEAYYQKAQAGEMPEDAAKNAALAAVETLRYEGNEYYFILNTENVMLMHPFAKKLVGTDSSGLQDPNGKYIFQEMNKVAAANGGGYVDYMWPRPDAEEPSPKLSYVEAFGPWGWIIGTGVYTDDIAAAFRAALIKRS